jgi:diadenosine tetraphosphatase ApaH/serine/threonine PP2A family protein phosphatase
VNTADAAQVCGYLERTPSFFGHTHLQGGFGCHRSGVLRIPRVGELDSERVYEFDPDVPYLVNPGSVGQPRDGDPRAAYALYTAGDRFVTLRRVEYDIAGAQARIREFHLPDVLADRLAIGS